MLYIQNAVLKLFLIRKPWQSIEFFKNGVESYMDNSSSDKLQEEILKFKPSFCINSFNTCSKERKIKIKIF